jgi:adenylate cyclase
VRVRIAGKRAALNIKVGGLVASRDEYEYEIPVEHARELLASCGDGIVEKTRHIVPIGEFEYEVDEFHGANEGLVVAEIELDDEAQEFPRPAWLGDEVTELERYYNVRLVKHPFRQWTAQERNP